MKETACMKIMRQTAAEDRIIHCLPQPLLPSATPYRNIDFDNEVKDACLSERSVRLGLKISKAIFVGDVGVGKTCLVNQFCHEIFDANYKATIGVDFEVERFDILNVPFNLQIWDTAGQERFRCLASAYYRGSQVIVIVFDISNLLSLQNCSMWYEETHKNNYKDPVVFLVGTKKDLVSDATYNIVEKEAIILANKLSAEYWSVSSKTGENVKDFFFRLAALAFNFSVLRELVSPTRKEISEDFVRLHNNNDTFEVKKSKCASCRR